MRYVRWYTMKSSGQARVSFLLGIRGLTRWRIECLECGNNRGIFEATLKGDLWEIRCRKCGFVEKFSSRFYSVK